MAAEEDVRKAEKVYRNILLPRGTAGAARKDQVWVGNVLFRRAPLPCRRPYISPPRGEELCRACPAWSFSG